MTINRSHGYWGKNGTVKAHRKSYTPREALERAQCRAEEFVGDTPDFRDQVRELMQILAQPPRASEYSGNNRRAL